MVDISLLHGTSSKLVPRIKKKGLKASQYVPGQFGVFLTNDKEVADIFAEIKVDEVNGDYAVCRVKADPKNLTADMVMYDLTLPEIMGRYDCDTGDAEKSVKCFEKKIKAGKVPYPKTVKDWKASLKGVSSVISMKPIPKDKIEC